MIAPFAWVAWTKFVRQGFTLSFVVEEGETVREIFGVWFIPLKWADQWYNVGRKRSKEKRTIFIDTHKIVYVDRFNKRHLVIPVNNAFAYHPYADSIILPANTKDTIEKVKAGLMDKLRGKAKYDPETHGTVIEVPHRTDTEYQLYPVKVDLLNTIKFDSIKLFKYFFGTAMLQRVEEARRNKQQISTMLIVGLIGVGGLIGFIVADNILPLTASHITTTVTTTMNHLLNSTSTTSTVSFPTTTVP